MMKPLAELKLQAAFGWEKAAASWLVTALSWIECGRHEAAANCLSIARTDLDLAALNLGRPRR